MNGLPKKNEGRRVVWLTLSIVRQQLNKALGCRIKSGDLEPLTQSVLDSIYPRKKRLKSK